MKRLTLVLIVLIVLTSMAFAWPDDPNVNLPVGVANGDQAVPHIVETSDGGCYVGWFDNRSGNYDIYLQRLNSAGEIQWTENGMAISSQPQNSWVADWCVAVDNNDNAIVALSDVRNGPDTDIYAYCVSPTGEFLWGADGVTISDAAEDEYEPQIIVLEDDGVIFSWLETGVAQKVIIRKLNSEGVVVWDPANITLESEFGMSYTRLAKAEASNFIVLFEWKQGTGMWAELHLYAQKYDTDGAALWDANHVAVYASNGISLWSDPEVIYDLAGGAYVGWYDSRGGMDHHAFVQHISSAGTAVWDAAGIQLSTQVGEFQFQPSLVADPISGVYAFFHTTSTNQDMWGVSGQFVNSAGTLGWSDIAHRYIPLGNVELGFVNAYPCDDDFIVTYFSGGFANSFVEAFRADNTGELVWGEEHVVLSSLASNKDDLIGVVNSFNQVISIWTDERNGSNDIFLQNVNADGTLGDLPFVPDPTIEITSPDDGTVIVELPFDVVMDVQNIESFMINFSTIQENATMMELISETTYSVSELGNGAAEIIAILCDSEGTPLDPVVSDTINVTILLSSVDDQGNEIPDEFALNAAYPNPFNPSTTISYAMKNSSQLSLKVFDINGREVATLHQGRQSVGSHSVIWNATDLSSGVYFVRMETSSFNATQKIIRLK
jgi:Secretion system C-terminal sorting domain